MTFHRPPWGLYLVSDETMFLDGSFSPFLESALRDGLRVVQLRAKTLGDSDFRKIGREIRRLTRQFGACFIVNDRMKAAVEIDADGVHLGQEDPSPEEARALLGPGKLVGLSTHNRGQIRNAWQRPVDYIGVGPVFPTATKARADPVVGLDLLRWACRETPVPVVAIGGITLGNLASVAAAGAENIAVVSAISRAKNPREAVKAFLNLGANQKGARIRKKRH